MSYILFWYPIGIFLASLFRSRKTTETDNYPNVSLIICAHNEEDVIAEKIEHSLSLDYPRDKLEIIVVSDGSTDRTNEIAGGYSDPRYRFISYPDRGGKVKALNTAFDHITGEIAVLTDANVMFENNAIKKLVAPFGDDSIGCVVGNVLLRSPDGSISGEGFYSKYEKIIHTAEGRLATLITIDGAMYALRREYIKPLPSDTITDDWYLASEVLVNRKKILYQPDAIGYELAAESVSGEFKRKVRMIAGGYQTAFRRFGLFFNPVLHPVVCSMFISHKFLRWNTMTFLVLLFVSNLFLFGRSLIFDITLIAQATFYLLALAGWMFNKKLTMAVFYIPYYFMAVNWAAALGLFKFIHGSQKVTWERGRD